MDTISKKILLWSSASTQALGQISRSLKNAGAAFIDIETISTDVIPKLQDKSFEGCIIYGGFDPTDFSRIKRLLTTIRNNRLAGLLPVIILTSATEYKEELYTAGANLVTSPDNVEEACQILSSLLQLLDRYKVGNLARFTR